MIDTMARKNDFAALRAIDMIARLRGLVPTTAKRSDGMEAALEEMRQRQAEDEDEDEEAEVEPEPTPEIVFDPPMPPELSTPVEPAPELEPPSPAQTRASATEAARAAVRRRLFRYEHLITRHPELSGEIRDLSDAEAYFDDADNLLPRELWPGIRRRPKIMTIDDKCGPVGDVNIRNRPTSFLLARHPGQSHLPSMQMVKGWK